MKRFRPFLALLLACWLLALPALADDEVGGDTSEPPSVSDSVEDAGPPSSEETPPEDPPASEDPPPEKEDPPDTSDDTPSFPDDGPSSSEDTPDTVDPDPVDPEPGTPAEPLPENPAPETPADSLPENPTPEAPADPVPVVPETPAGPLPENPVPETPVVVPETPADPLPVYPVPDTSVSPGLQETPGVIYEAGTGVIPAVENHQIFTITTIPEFALALMESDAGNTMAQVVRDLFGTYTPRVQTVTTYMDGEPIAVEEQYVPGVAGMDWEWIGGFAVFLLMLYCLFRLLGGSVKYG